MPITKEFLADKARACLWGVFIGDARGLPLECSSPSGIIRNFGYVDRYVSNRHHPFSNVAKQPKGTISDDSQLTLIMMDAFSKAGHYDLGNIVEAHIDGFDGKWGPKVGWGKTTREACEKMKQGMPSVVKEGAGNGAPIKIAPLALYCAFRTMKTSFGKYVNSFNESLLKKCREVTELTHGDPRCIVASYCQARMVIRAIQNEIPPIPISIAKMFITDAQYAEAKLAHKIPNWPDGPLLSERLEQFLTPEKLIIEVGAISAEICTEKSSFVCNSYVLVAFCASKYLPYRNFRHAIDQTINAGADADSNGSMVGSIAGAMLGMKSVPSELMKGLVPLPMLSAQINLFLNLL